MKWIVSGQILFGLLLAGHVLAEDPEELASNPQERSQMFMDTAEGQYLESKYADAYQSVCLAVEDDPDNLSAQQLKEKLHLVLGVLLVPADPVCAAKSVTPSAQPLIMPGEEKQASAVPSGSTVAQEEQP